MQEVSKCPDLDLLDELFSYDSHTGELTRRITCGGRPAGSVAGCYHEGYVRVRINNKGYLVHRIAWKIYYREEPPKYIDHINNIADDNRISNLRKCEKYQNVHHSKTYSNNTSGQKGVYKKGTRWHAFISVNGGNHNLGYHDTFEEAVTARINAEQKLLGEFQPV